MSLDAPAPGGEVDDPQSLAENLGDEDDGFRLVEAKLSLSDAIARLPYLERQALRLRVEHDLKQVDIAHQLDCSQMQVSRLLRRAAARMRDLSEPDPGRFAGGRHTGR
jgi:RNA polymerase sigma-B factor